MNAHKFSAWLLASAVPNKARFASRKGLLFKDLQVAPTAIRVRKPVEVADLNQTGGFRP
jgi:hypothetical protein